MKTAKYYRFNEKVGGMRGGAVEKGPGKIRRKFKGWGHSIAAPFKRPIQNSGLNRKQSNGTSEMSTKQILDERKSGFQRVKNFINQTTQAPTKSARLRQGLEKALGLSLKDQRRADKITNTPKLNAKPLSKSKQTKREEQARKIALKLKINTKDRNFSTPEGRKESYTYLQGKIKKALNAKKKTYETETFQTLNKTKKLTNALETSQTKYTAAKKNTSNKTRNYTNQKKIINLLKLLKTTPENIKVREQLLKLDPDRFRIHTNTKNDIPTFNPDIKIDNQIKDVKKTRNTKKIERDKAFKTEEKQAQTFTKNSKALEAHTAKYGTTNALKQYSNKQTIASKTGRALAQGAKYTAIATGVAGLGALTTVAPPVGILLGAEGLATVAGVKLNKKFTKKSSLLKTLNSNKATANSKEYARNLIINKTSSPEVQYKLDKALDKGQDLINKLGDQKKTLLSGTYNAFKKSLKDSNITYTSEDYKILKEYYAAHKIKQIREGTKFSKNSELGKTTPSSFPFSKKADPQNPKSFKPTTEQRLQTYETQQIQSLPKNETSAKLSELKIDNYEKFLPLLRIKPESVKTNTTLKNLFTNKKTFNQKQTELKEIIKNKYTKLKESQPTTINQNSAAELEKIEKFAALYNIELPSPPL